MSIYVGVALPILVMSIFHAPCQVEELGFEWLPAGRYYLIQHVNLEACNKEKVWKVYYEHHRVAERDKGLMNLPRSFGDYRRVTIALTLRLSIDKKWLKSLDESVISSLNSEMTELFVYQFDDMDDLISVALEEGEIEDTGQMYQNRKIYSYKGRGEEAGSAAKYGASTGLGEWLAAADINRLKIMLACGFGAHPNILMNENIDELLELTEYPGQDWLIAMPFEEREIQLEALKHHEKIRMSLSIWLR